MQLATDLSSIRRAQRASNLTTVHGDMLLGLIFTPRLYKHIPWPSFHVPVVKLDPPTSPMGDTFTLRIDRHTAEMIDICGAFKSFSGAKKYMSISFRDSGFIAVRLRGSMGLSMLQYVIVPHLKGRYPGWNVELDTEILYGSGKHKDAYC